MNVKANGTVTIHIQALSELLKEAARTGIEVGKAGTDGDHTDTGIAYKVLTENGWLG